MQIIKIIQLLTIMLTSAVFVGCASTDTDDSGQIDASAAVGDASASGIGNDAAVAGGAAVDQFADIAADLATVFYFEFDQATLTVEAKAALDGHISRLSGTLEAVRLEGHADERGTREYNLALGERRANAIANYLIINGIERGRIETVSYGEERPLSFGQDEYSMAQNRRVELK